MCIYTLGSLLRRLGELCILVCRVCVVYFMFLYLCLGLYIHMRVCICAYTYTETLVTLPPRSGELPPRVCMHCAFHVCICAYTCESAASIRRTAAKVHDRVCMHCVIHVCVLVSAVVHAYACVYICAYTDKENGGKVSQ
jgi:hypothetical protein